MKITDKAKVPTRKTKKGVLKMVRKLLSDYENWIQGEWETTPGDPDGREDRFCYCLNGAINAVSATSELAGEVKAEVDRAIPKRWLKATGIDIEMQIRSDPEWPIIDLNDGAFHKSPKGAWKAILKVLDTAEARA